MDKLTSRQISEWEAYDRIDPIGEWRAEFREARLEALITNIVQALFPKKGTVPTSINPLDLMPDWTGDKEQQGKQTVEQQKQILMAFARDQNKRVEREEQRKRKINDTRKPVKKDGKHRNINSRPGSRPDSTK